MEAVAFGFALAQTIALGILIWLYSKPGKKWLQQMH